ncbi:MAG: SDR family NAD(P)-dependent oxidoreductase, partial [Cyanobacteria bacterium J06636_16]
HFVVVCPRQPMMAVSETERIQSIVERLQTGAALAAKAGSRSGAIAYIQFGGGYFGSMPQVTSIEQCCTTAFAASQHLEQPALKVRVLDFDPSVQPSQIANCFVAEVSTSSAFAAAGYDTQMTRRMAKAHVQSPANYRSRNLSWSPQDVVLVTGGAKGITAECALAFAQAKGVRMALVGSSPHPDGQLTQRTEEIAATLARFERADITCRYYSCDITSAEAVLALTEQVKQELGPITGVIHGAAINKPRRAEQPSSAEAYREIAPKLQGVLNLCYVLRQHPPKLFAAFSSIIGVTGMVGNAWYGFSNEALNLVLQQFTAAHPETAVTTAAFSVWGEVGMGARMGSVRTLEKMGIQAIPTEEGVSRFLDLLESDPGKQQIVIAARLGGLDTWPSETLPKPNTRFLEAIRYYEPNVQVIARVQLSLETDLYIQDHLYRGSYLFPTVYGLEAMAQAIAYATGNSRLDTVRIEDIRLERPIVVSPGQNTEIEIRVEVLEQERERRTRRVRAGIGTEQTGFKVDHFSAVFVLAAEPLQTCKAMPAPKKPLAINPQQDLYRETLLFQGPLFQRIQHIYQLECSEQATGACIFSACRRDTASDGKEGFSPEKSLPLILGDPYLRDALLQSVQLIIPQDICLPIRIDCLEINAAGHQFTGERMAVTVLEGREDKTYRSRVQVIDATGQVIEQLSGYQLRILEHHPENPKAQDLARINTTDEALLRNAVTQLESEFQISVPHFLLRRMPGLSALSKVERHHQELPILHELIQITGHQTTDLPPEIQWSEIGKPMVVGASAIADISISHTDALLLCSAGSHMQGCDLELVPNLDRDGWVSLLGKHQANLITQLMVNGESLNVAGTQIWSAVEAVRKATGTSGSVPLTLAKQ